MPRTPDEFPGERVEESLLLEPTNNLPIKTGEMLYVSGSGFFFNEEGIVRGPISSFNMANQRAYEDKTFSAYVSGVSNANNKNMLAIVNKSNSGQLVRIVGIKIVNTSMSTITGTAAKFELKRIVSVSNATSVTIQPHDTQDVVDASIVAYTGGTVSGENTNILNKWVWSTDEWGSGTLDQEGSQLITQNLFVWEVKPGVKPYTLRENEGMMIVFRGSTTAGTHDILFEIEIV